MQETTKDAIVVSPASTLRHMLLVSAFRSLIGMCAVIWIVGVGALPIVVPGVAAFIVCARASHGLRTRLFRLGLCLSSSMWIGASAAIVVHSPTAHAIFLAISLSAFAVTDVMLATMRMEHMS